MSFDRAALAICACVATGALSQAVADAQPADLASRIARLRVGMWVRVEGHGSSDRVLEAARLRVFNGERDEVEVETEVAALDLVRMTLETPLGLRVVATATTEWEGPGQQRHVGLAGVAVGDRIEVEGRLDSDGSLRAEKIDIEKRKRPEPVSENEHKLTARIDSIDATGQRIAVLGLPVQLRPTTRISLPD